MMRVASMHPGELSEILDSVDADLVQRCLACDYSDLRTERRGNEHTPKSHERLYAEGAGSSVHNCCTITSRSCSTPGRRA